MEIRASRRPSAARSFFSGLWKFLVLLGLVCVVMAIFLGRTNVIDGATALYAKIAGLVFCVIGVYVAIILASK